MQNRKKDYTIQNDIKVISVRVVPENGGRQTFFSSMSIILCGVLINPDTISKTNNPHKIQLTISK